MNLRHLFLVLALAICVGCIRDPMIVRRTDPAAPAIQTPASGSQIPLKLLYLTDAEAKCPNRCSEVVKGKEDFAKFSSMLERMLMDRGFELVSGAVVSRVEDRLRENKSREVWDRLEKALLLGKDTGADAIFEVKTLYVDEFKRVFLKNGNEPYTEVPERYATEVLARDHHARVFALDFWSATVELRALDLAGRVIWAGQKTVRITDVLPTDWNAKVDGEGEVMVRNFDYQMYLYNKELIADTLNAIIKELVQKMPSKVDGKRAEGK